MFTPDENLEEKVEKHITDPDGSVSDLSEAFNVFVQDFCQESLVRHKHEQSDKPWDACNLLPQKPPVEVQELVEKTTSELKDVLTSVPPTTVSGEFLLLTYNLFNIVMCGSDSETGFPENNKV